MNENENIDKFNYNSNNYDIKFRSINIDQNFIFIKLNKSLKIYDVNVLKCVETINVDDNCITAYEVSSSKSYIAINSTKRLIIYQIKLINELCKIDFYIKMNFKIVAETQNENVINLSISSLSDIILSLDSFAKVKIFDSNNLSLTKTICAFDYYNINNFNRSLNIEDFNYFHHTYDTRNICLFKIYKDNKIHGYNTYESINEFNNDIAHKNSYYQNRIESINTLNTNNTHYNNNNNFDSDLFSNDNYIMNYKKYNNVSSAVLLFIYKNPNFYNKHNYNNNNNNNEEQEFLISNCSNVLNNQCIIEVKEVQQPMSIYLNSINNSIFLIMTNSNSFLVTRKVIRGNDKPELILSYYLNLNPVFFNNIEFNNESDCDNKNVNGFSLLYNNYNSIFSLNMQHKGTIVDVLPSYIVNSDYWNTINNTSNNSNINSTDFENELSLSYSNSINSKSNSSLTPIDYILFNQNEIIHIYIIDGLHTSISDEITMKTYKNFNLNFNNNEFVEFNNNFNVIKFIKTNNLNYSAYFVDNNNLIRKFNFNYYENKTNSKFNNHHNYYLYEDNKSLKLFSKIESMVHNRKNNKFLILERYDNKSIITITNNKLYLTKVFILNDIEVSKLKWLDYERKHCNYNWDFSNLITFIFNYKSVSSVGIIDFRSIQYNERINYINYQTFIEQNLYLYTNVKNEYESNLDILENNLYIYTINDYYIELIENSVNNFNETSNIIKFTLYVNIKDTIISRRHDIFKIPDISNIKQDSINNYILKNYNTTLKEINKIEIICYNKHSKLAVACLTNINNNESLIQNTYNLITNTTKNIKTVKDKKSDEKLVIKFEKIAVFEKKLFYYEINKKYNISYIFELLPDSKKKSNNSDENELVYDFILQGKILFESFLENDMFVLITNYYVESFKLSTKFYNRTKNTFISDTNNDRFIINSRKIGSFLFLFNISNEGITTERLPKNKNLFENFKIKFNNHQKITKNITKYFPSTGIILLNNSQIEFVNNISTICTSNSLRYDTSSDTFYNRLQNLFLLNINPNSLFELETILDYFLDNKEDIVKYILKLFYNLQNKLIEEHFNIELSSTKGLPNFFNLNFENIKNILFNNSLLDVENLDEDIFSNKTKSASKSNSPKRKVSSSLSVIKNISDNDLQSLQFDFNRRLLEFESEIYEDLKGNEKKLKDNFKSSINTENNITNDNNNNNNNNNINFRNRNENKRSSIYNNYVLIDSNNKKEHSSYFNKENKNTMQLNYNTNMETNNVNNINDNTIKINSDNKEYIDLFKLNPAIMSLKDQSNLFYRIERNIMFYKRIKQEQNNKKENTIINIRYSNDNNQLNKKNSKSNNLDNNNKETDKELNLRHIKHIYETIIGEDTRNLDNITKYFVIKIKSKSLALDFNSFKLTSLDLCWLNLINDQEYIIKFFINGNLLNTNSSISSYSTSTFGLNQSISNNRNINFNLLKKFCIPMWIKNNFKLKELLEISGKNEYNQLLISDMGANNTLVRNLAEQVALYFYLAGKNNLVIEKYEKESHNSAALKFLKKDFNKNENNRRLARENAYNLLSKKRYLMAIYMFLLGNDFKSAVNCALDNLKDINLTICIIKLYPLVCDYCDKNQISEETKFIYNKNFFNFGIFVRDPWLIIYNYLVFKQYDKIIEYIQTIKNYNITEEYININKTNNLDKSFNDKFLEELEFINSENEILNNVIDMQIFDYKLFFYLKEIEKLYNLEYRSQQKNLQSVSNTNFDEIWGNSDDDEPSNTNNTPSTINNESTENKLKEVKPFYSNLLNICIEDSISKGVLISPIISYYKENKSKFFTDSIKPSILLNFIDLFCKRIVLDTVNLQSMDNNIILENYFKNIESVILYLKNHRFIDNSTTVYSIMNLSFLKLEKYNFSIYSSYKSKNTLISLNIVRKVFEAESISIINESIRYNNPENINIVKVFNFLKNKVYSIAYFMQEILLFIENNSKDDKEDNTFDSILASTIIIRIVYQCYIVVLSIAKISNRYNKIREIFLILKDITINYNNFLSNPENLKPFLEDITFYSKTLCVSLKHIKPIDNSTAVMFKMILNYSVITKVSNEVEDLLKTDFYCKNVNIKNEIDNSLVKSEDKFKFLKRLKLILDNYINNFEYETRRIISNYLTIKQKIDSLTELRDLYNSEINQSLVSNYTKFNVIDIKKFFKNSDKFDKFESYFKIKEKVFNFISCIPSKLYYEKKSYIENYTSESIDIISKLFNKSGFELAKLNEEIYKISSFDFNVCNISQLAIALGSNGHKRINTLPLVLKGERSTGICIIIIIFKFLFLM